VADFVVGLTEVVELEVGLVVIALELGVAGFVLVIELVGLVVGLVVGFEVVVLEVY